MRTLLNKPIRQTTTAIFHENQITLQEFADEIKSTIDGYVSNLINLNIKEPMYIEQWFESFMAYCEVEQNDV